MIHLFVSKINVAQPLYNPSPQWQNKIDFFSTLLLYFVSRDIRWDTSQRYYTSCIPLKDYQKDLTKLESGITYDSFDLAKLKEMSL